MYENQETVIKNQQIPPANELPLSTKSQPFTYPKATAQIEYHVIKREPIMIGKSKLVPFFNSEVKRNYPMFVKNGYVLNSGGDFGYKW